MVILELHGYFTALFAPKLGDDVVYQANHYARQKNVNKAFVTNIYKMVVVILCQNKNPES